MAADTPIYKRVLLKLSGEVLSGDRRHQLAGAALGLQARARVPGAPTKHTWTRCQ